MCRDRLLVGLRAIVNATCESLATMVGAPLTSCSIDSASGPCQVTKASCID